MPAYESNLTDEEARRLIDMLKYSTQEAISFPSLGKKREFEVIGETKRDIFLVYIFRGTVEVRKCNISGRTKEGTQLMELHLSPTTIHLNPDGTKINGSHLHIYTQEYGRRYAVPFDLEDRSIVENCIVFMNKFNIIKRPEILHAEPLA